MLGVDGASQAGQSPAKIASAIENRVTGNTRNRRCCIGGIAWIPCIPRSCITIANKRPLPSAPGSTPVPTSTTAIGTLLLRPPNSGEYRSIGRSFGERKEVEVRYDGENFVWFMLLHLNRGNLCARRSETECNDEKGATRGAREKGRGTNVAIIIDTLACKHCLSCVRRNVPRSYRSLVCVLLRVRGFLKYQSPISWKSIRT